MIFVEIHAVGVGISVDSVRELRFQRLGDGPASAGSCAEEPGPKIGALAGFEISDPGPKIGALAGFEFPAAAARTYRQTVSRLTCSSRAIRRADHPCAYSVKID
jgi:hypothetical protein